MVSDLKHRVLGVVLQTLKGHKNETEESKRKHNPTKSLLPNSPASPHLESGTVLALCFLTMANVNGKGSTGSP